MLYVNASTCPGQSDNNGSRKGESGSSQIDPTRLNSTAVESSHDWPHLDCLGIVPWDSGVVYCGHRLPTFGRTGTKVTE